MNLTRPCGGRPPGRRDGLCVPANDISPTCVPEMLDVVNDRSQQALCRSRSTRLREICGMCSLISPVAHGPRKDATPPSHDKFRYVTRST